MESNTIEQGNKLIAEFMGKRLTDSAIEAAFDDNIWHESELKYHSSWDWLMPVVEKIWNLEDDWTEGGEGDTKWFNAVQQPVHTPIKIVWEAVVQFIEWFNKAEK